MSNVICYDLDVLTSNPGEINPIAQRLNQPSLELTNWLAEKFGKPVGDTAESLKELLEFEILCSPSFAANDVNKARGFRISSKYKYSGVIESHLYEVSEAFPTAIFLINYYDMQESYAGKWVIRAGELVQQIRDGDQQAQAIDWALLDIFAPFRAENELGLEFGSLWQKWLAAVAAAVQDLKGETALRE